MTNALFVEKITSALADHLRARVRERALARFLNIRHKPFIDA